MFLTSNTGPPLPLPPGQLNESSSTVCGKFRMTQFSSKVVTKTFFGAAFSYEDSSLSFCDKIGNKNLFWLHFLMKILHFRFFVMVTKTFLAAFSYEDSSLSFFVMVTKNLFGCIFL
jgi:hypothetical protein